MPYTIQRHAGEPILTVMQEPGSDVAAEMLQSILDITQALDEQKEPVFLVVGIESSRLTISMIARAADLAARGSQSMLHHYNLRETVVVSTSYLVRAAMGVLTSPMFGEVRLTFADTLQQAVDYCHDALKSPQAT